ncbi:elongation of very long chain fatty acids protein F-like [Vespula pensylvanica]|uniref:elongation of very long chain fatty acids protein F-like n=1 Tax=Vespula pensylvanica TaxID=30213 RepID=UPI001CBA3A9F|nr:elongation of very long chain fatty acids protein F-like [Vespula pensylvanica]
MSVQCDRSVSGYFRIRTELLDNVLFKPSIVGSILFSYLYFVFVCAPRFMRYRSLYSLKTFARYYDVFQIVLNSFILFYSSYSTYFLKFIDLIETGIFVLRKNDRQILFLHLYHHVSTCVIIINWIYEKHYTIDMITFLSLVNCNVHVIMYSYYFLSKYGAKLVTEN